MNSSIYTVVIPAPPGKLGMVLENSLVTELSWLSQSHPLLAPYTNQAKAACSALSDYLESADAFPELPIRLSGSNFQLKVWQALQQIPVAVRSGRPVVLIQLQYWCLVIALSPQAGSVVTWGKKGSYI